ncbi:Transmembrane protease serine 9 [Zancudomyces culisetae]|uniref:Transmembrane protease serine 9 n=1 Tax=Zancudomyces culisetae TaxID=1213189 RepID=A0A1R1PLZ2_ZANCU|nr:Transmembrane protease serine 9 [Zancudomyces culisetae]|eukprot:OMH81990.1 Transmembrane protease serine 9 [Zancudomyces culisetae]
MVKPLALLAYGLFLKQAKSQFFPNFNTGVNRRISGDERIINGMIALPNEFPSIVALSITSGVTSFTCSGSILNANFILTAAHCMYPGQTIITPAQIRVGYGNSNRAQQKVVQVKNITVNPGYDPNAIIISNDVAILELSEPIVLSPGTAETILFTANTLPPGTSVTGAGWGAITQAPNANAVNELRKVGLVVGDVAFCQRIRPDYSLNGQTICTNTMPGNVDTCYGDSGGPMYYKESSGVLTLAGILSYGDTPDHPQRPVCADPNGAGFYAKPISFLDFISSVTKISQAALVYSPNAPSASNAPNVPGPIPMPAPTPPLGNTSSAANSIPIQQLTMQTASSPPIQQPSLLPENSTPPQQLSTPPAIAPIGTTPASVGTLSSATIGTVVYVYQRVDVTIQSCPPVQPSSQLAASSSQVGVASANPTTSDLVISVAQVSIPSANFATSQPAASFPQTSAPSTSPTTNETVISSSQPGVASASPTTSGLVVSASQIGMPSTSPIAGQQSATSSEIAGVLPTSQSAQTSSTSTATALGVGNSSVTTSEAPVVETVAETIAETISSQVTSSTANSSSTSEAPVVETVAETVAETISNVETQNPSTAAKRLGTDIPHVVELFRDSTIFNRDRDVETTVLGNPHESQVSLTILYSRIGFKPNKARMNAKPISTRTTESSTPAPLPLPVPVPIFTAVPTATPTPTEGTGYTVTQATMLSKYTIDFRISSIEKPHQTEAPDPGRPFQTHSALLGKLLNMV